MNTTERAIVAYFACLIFGGVTAIVAVAEFVSIVLESK